MDYEDFEPDVEDEFYDEMCAVAYAKMFNGGINYEDLSECSEWINPDLLAC